jgi:hypothetical protein
MPSNRVSAQQEAAIISACEEHERQKRWQSGRLQTLCKCFFVKFSSHISLYPQTLHSGTSPNSQPAAQVYHTELYHFTRDLGLAMEYIELDDDVILTCASVPKGL